MERVMKSPPRQNDLRTFVALSPVDAKEKNRDAMFGPNFDQNACFFGFRLKILFNVVSAVLFKLFTPLCNFISKSRMFFGIFELSTAVDNFVRNLSSFSASETIG
jgi:hypothetical protein